MYLKEGLAFFKLNSDIQTVLSLINLNLPSFSLQYHFFPFHKTVKLTGSTQISLQDPPLGLTPTYYLFIF